MCCTLFCTTVRVVLTTLFLKFDQSSIENIFKAVLDL
jgi:hypothetical protein